MHSALYDGLVEMVPPPLAGRSVGIRPRRGEDPLPRPLTAGVGVLPGEGMRQLHPPGARAQVALVLRTDTREVTLQRGPYDGRKEGHPVAISLPAPDDDLIRRELEILDAQPRALQEAKAGPVEKDRHQPWC